MLLNDKRDRIIYDDNERGVYWRVIDEVINGIKTQKYVSGAQIPTEKELMEQLRVSRGPVREAIKILSSLGIVKIKRGEGTFITDGSNLQMIESVAYTLLMANTSQEDFLEFRYYVETMILTAAAEKVTDEDIAELENLIDKAQTAYEEKDIETIRELDVQFHNKIVEFTRNPFIIKMVKGVYELANRETISKNPNVDIYYRKAKESHLDDVRYLKTKDPKYIEKDLKFARSKITLSYEDK